MPSRMDSYRYWAEQHTTDPKLMHEKFPYPIQDFMGDRSICPICDGWKYPEKDSGFDISKYCLCSTLEWVERQREQLLQYEAPVLPATLDAMVSMKSKDRYRQEVYDRMWKDQQQIIAYVDEWIKSPKTWIAMFGGNGTGKTHVLRAIKTALPDMAFYISSADFSARVFRGLDDHNYGEFVDFCCIVPILLLDDWGIEHSTSMTTDALAYVIDARYTHPAEFPTVITSNNLGVFDSPDIAIRRIASRVGDRQICHRFFINSADFRLPDGQRKGVID